MVSAMALVGVVSRTATAAMGVVSRTGREAGRIAMVSVVPARQGKSPGHAPCAPQ